MSRTVGIEDFLSEHKLPLIDVRSPAEFGTGHIPGAINVPLFTDDERAQVGTVYKQVSKEKAIEIGHELVGPKLERFEEIGRSLGDVTRVHCWRGGMRSQGMADFLTSKGTDCILLEGGYKSYRGAIVEFFSRPMALKVLTGLTGSMKTEVLHALQEHGQQVIDLEGAASHEGSSFGNAKCSSQPTTEQFQNLLFEQARKFNLNRPIWIEDEEFVIGKVHGIKSLFDQKEASDHLFIEIPIARRVQHLVEGYGKIEPSKLVAATNGIRKKLGHQRADLAIEAIRAEEYATAAEICLAYYDKQYLSSIERKRDKIKQQFTFKDETVEEIAEKLIDAIRA